MQSKLLYRLAQSTLSVKKTELRPGAEAVTVTVPFCHWRCVVRSCGPRDGGYNGIRSKAAAGAAIAETHGNSMHSISVLIPCKHLQQLGRDSTRL